MKPLVNKEPHRVRKFRGLQRLKWYCQACEKQCRDEHGFKLHKSSPSHRAKAEQLKAQIPQLSEQFAKNFLAYLRRVPAQSVDANKLYGEIISEPNHIHMNATRWHSLSAFIRSLQASNQIVIVQQQPLTIKLMNTQQEQQQKEAEQAQLHKKNEQLLAHQQVLESQLRDGESQFSSARTSSTSAKSNINTPTSAGNTSGTNPTETKITFSLNRKKKTNLTGINI